MNQQASCNNQSVSAFPDLGISAEINQVLTKKEFTIPTAIQQRAIPVAISGQDLIGIAQTGTGKTFAFALPIIQKLLNNSEQALIVVPTRELAWQVEESFRSIMDHLNNRLSSVTLIGGVPMERQRARFKKMPRIIIATPGRLQDHLNRRTFNLNNCKTIVLDEADRMFDIGFAPQVKEIFALAPKERQTMLFSATMPEEIRDLCNKHLNNPVEITVTKQGVTGDLVKQELCIVAQADKSKMLEKVLAGSSGQTIVFSKTKIGTKKLAKIVYNMGFDSAELHSDRSMAQRRQALDGFRQGRYQVLIATDIAARGIDVSDIELVVNYDLPQAAEDYVHRIGRTGRAGKTGRAISFASPEQKRDIRKIEHLTSIKFDLFEHSLPFTRQAESNNSGPRKRAEGEARRGGGRRFGRFRRKSTSVRTN